MSNSALARRQLDSRLEKLKAADGWQPPARGWGRAIRDSLGMPAAQLARRIGVTQPAVADLERREASGALTLNTLAAAARALDCTLVYALVPNDSLEGAMRRRAREVAARRLGRVGHTMRLESQDVPAAETAAQVDELADELIRTRPRALWLEP